MSEEINKKTNKDVTKRLQCISTDAASAIVDSTRIETSNQPQSAIDKRKYDLSSSSDDVSVCSKTKYVKPLKTKETQSDSPSESEEELQVIEFGSKCSDNSPLLIMFPELKQEGMNLNITKQMSTTALTKLLVGKKAAFPLLRKNQQLFKNKHTLTPIEEFPENMSYEQIAWRSPRSTLNSELTDLSDEETDL